MVGVGRGELTDAAWAKIAPLLPPAGKPVAAGVTTARLGPMEITIHGWSTSQHCP
jgi:hypothetical protein